MTMKKVCIMVGLLLFLMAAAAVAIHFFRTSKHVYEGVLVFNQGVEQEYKA